MKSSAFFVFALVATLLTGCASSCGGVKADRADQAPLACHDSGALPHHRFTEF